MAANRKEREHRWWRLNGREWHPVADNWPAHFNYPVPTRTYVQACIHSSHFRVTQVLGEYMSRGRPKNQDKKEKSKINTRVHRTTHEFNSDWYAQLKLLRSQTLKMAILYLYVMWQWRGIVRKDSRKSKWDKGVVSWESNWASKWIEIILTFFLKKKW